MPAIIISIQILNSYLLFTAIETIFTEIIIMTLTENRINEI